MASSFNLAKYLPSKLHMKGAMGWENKNTSTKLTNKTLTSQRPSVSSHYCVANVLLMCCQCVANVLTSLTNKNLTSQRPSVSTHYIPLVNSILTLSKPQCILTLSKPQCIYTLYPTSKQYPHSISHTHSLYNSELVCIYTLSHYISHYCIVRECACFRVQGSGCIFRK